MIIEKAEKMATELHFGQTRKFTTAPYIIHPKEVAKLVIENKKSRHINELVAAALLHDTIEDCGITEDYLLKHFGVMVTDIVSELTNNKELIRKYGKKQYLLYKTIGFSNYALVIKIADRIHNTEDLLISPPEFRDRYTNETLEFIEVIKDYRNLTSSQLKLLKKLEYNLGIN